jgi:hypothetical protein
MNYSTAIFLVNPAVRAVTCIYQPDPTPNGKNGYVDGAASNPRTMFKTFDKSIQVDDLVLVPSNTRFKVTVNKVIAVDVSPDFDSTVEIQWIIGKVDRAAYENTLSDEGRYIQLIRQAEETDQRNKLREKMLAHVDQAKLDQLRITGSVDEPPAV